MPACDGGLAVPTGAAAAATAAVSLCVHGFIGVVFQSAPNLLSPCATPKHAKLTKPVFSTGLAVPAARQRR
jgi:hypothetical protein